MIVIRNQISIFNFLFILTVAHTATVKDVFTSNLAPEISKNGPVLQVRVPREIADPLEKPKDLDVSESLKVPLKASEKVIRKARNSKYYSDSYGSNSKSGGRSLKPEDNLEDNRDVKDGTALGKRCTTCDTGYLGSFNTRSRDRYDRNYERDPYSKYDRYDRYDRDRYDRYDDYDRDGYRGRNRYSSSYDRYDPRDRYSDRGTGYDNRGYNYRDYYRDDYSPYYYRDRYDPYDDYYSRGSGYDSISRGGGGGYDSASRGGGYYSGRPEYNGGGGGGYARGYSYGDRDRYGSSGYGSGGGYGSGAGYGSGGSYGSSGGYGSGAGYGSGSGYSSGGGYGGYGGGYGTSDYGNYYGAGGSRSRYPSNDYDSGYRSTSYLYGRPSSTTTDMPKNSAGESNTASPSSPSSSLGRNN